MTCCSRIACRSLTNPRRAVVVHPKFYLFDAGVYRSLRPTGPLDRPEEIEAQALKGLVGQHLRAWIDYSGRSFKLFFWRTRSGVEVDFVVCGDEGLLAFETKNTGRIQPQDLRGPKAFKQDYPQCRPYFVYRGKERLMKDGILCLPCEEFLVALDPRRLIGENL